MKIVGCDLHTRYQQIAMLDEETGELIERRLENESGEARAFYASLEGPVRVGIEATGHTRSEATVATPPLLLPVWLDGGIIAVNHSQGHGYCERRCSPSDSQIWSTFKTLASLRARTGI